MQKNSITLRIVRVGVLAAISVILMFTIRFSPFPAVPHLEYTPAGIPILFSTLMFGTIEGLFLSFVVSILQWLTVSQHSGWIGALMQFLAMGSFVLMTGLIYKVKRTASGATIALLFGGAVSTVVMIGWNLIFTPIFWGTPIEAVWVAMPWIVAFNASRAIVNSIIAFAMFRMLKDKIFKI